MIDAEQVSAAVGADFSEVLSEPLHVCLTEGASGAVFMWRGPQTYEVHLFFAVHGREAIDLFQRMMDLMRVIYDAKHFWALVPIASRHVRWFARRVGWKSQGLVETRHGMNELFTENSGCRH
ncbi:MAG TPA: hypothetical protein VJ859_02945 [Allosphingosinicella sp.]|nr:hypothetical protein [Allosphingosinicella sp.]